MDLKITSRRELIRVLTYVLGLDNVIFLEVTDDELKMETTDFPEDYKIEIMHLKWIVRVLIRALEAVDCEGLGVVFTEFDRAYILILLNYYYNDFDRHCCDGFLSLRKFALDCVINERSKSRAEA